ncbi:MAG TPA: carboxypeptidase regulatory-like domain-containing protein [Stenomitos sp.]
MRRLVVALAMLPLLARPASAGPTLWGYQGLVTMPDARVAQERELEVGLQAIALRNRPMAMAGFARYGLLSGLEASLLYGVPGYPYVTGGLKYQLLRPTTTNPTAVAFGATLLGVPAAGPVAGTSYFLSLSRDLGRWGSLHAGFEGDLSLNTRLMVGMELPLGGLGRLMLEGWGPQTGSAPYANVGAELSPLPWVRLEAGSLGEPGADWLTRSYFGGGSLHGVLPEYSQWFTRPKATPAPGPGPSPAPSRSGASPGQGVQPPALPAGTIIGRVVGADGTPRAGLTILLVGTSKRTTSNSSGYFYFPALPPGSYQLQVLDRSGTPLTTATASLGTEPVIVTLPLKEGRLPSAQEQRGSLSGTVADAVSGAPLAETRLVVVGPGVSVLVMSQANGQFQVIDLPLGDYQIRAERKGYRPETGSAKLEAAAKNPILRLMMTRERS